MKNHKYKYAGVAYHDYFGAVHLFEHWLFLVFGVPIFSVGVAIISPNLALWFFPSTVFLVLLSWINQIAKYEEYEVRE